jgi:outer membrane receptor protein involved in Fe transport
MSMICPPTPLIAAANGYAPLDKKWTRFNPTATIAYDVNDDVHVYAKYATGYRARRRQLANGELSGVRSGGCEIL